MKKALIISAFILGGAVIMTGLALLNMWLIIELSDVGWILSLLIDITLGISLSFIIKKIMTTKGISRKIMLLSLHLPAVIGGIIFIIKGAMTPRGYLLSGRFLAGLGDVLIGIALLVIDFVLAIATIVGSMESEHETADRTEQAAPQNTPEQTENEKTEV